jgi:hypothetical protein
MASSIARPARTNRVSIASVTIRVPPATRLLMTRHNASGVWRACLSSGELIHGVGIGNDAH